MPTPSRARIAATFHVVSHRPNAIARVGRELWVTSASRPLIRIDALTGRERTPDSRLGPGGKAISVQGDIVWVANRRTREIVAVAAAPPHRLLARLPQSEFPVDVAGDPRGGLWVAVRGPTADGPGTVLRYDADERLLHSIPVAAGISAIVLGPRAVWVAEYNAARLLRIDRRTGRPAGGAELLQPAGALAYGGGCVWATMTGDDAVARKCPHRTPVPADAGHHPEHLTYARGRVYVASRFDQALVVIDPRRMKPVQRLPMPFSPFAVTSDRRHVWVTSLAEDSVTRVDLQ